MKKLKLSFLIAVLSLAVGIGSAQAADLNFNNDTNVSIGGHNYTVVAGSVATTQMILTANTLTVTVPSVGTFTIKSPDGYALGSTGNIAQSCTGGVNVLTIGAGLGPIVITPNPASAVCAGAVVVSGSGGLTSGTGSTTPPPSTTPPVIIITPLTPSITTISGCNNGTIGFSTVTGQPCAGNLNIETTVIPGCNGTLGFSTVTGQTCVNNFTQGTTPINPNPNSYDFGTVTLKNGSSGNAVMELQRFLNRFLNLSLVVDGKLGPKTIAVLKKWQKDNGLVADGLIGPKTKALMNTWAATR